MGSIFERTMADKYLRIGSLVDITGYNSADFTHSVEAEDPIKCGIPVDGGDAVRVDDLTDGTIFDGDHTDVSWNPTNYTPDASIAEADDAGDLSAHLKGIDDELLNIIIGDGTAGRKLRCTQVFIEDATTAANIKVSLTAVATWTGDVIAAEDNLAKSGSTTSFTLNANGGVLTIDGAKLATLPIAVLAAVVTRNRSGTAVTVSPTITSNDIQFYFCNAATGAEVDLTNLVDTGTIRVQLIYILT